MDLRRTLSDAGVMLVLRTDAIGDNVIGAALLEPLRKAAPRARIIYACQDRIVELFEACPQVDQVLGFNRSRACADEEYRDGIQARLEALRADVVLNPMVTGEALSDELVMSTKAPVRVGFFDDRGGSVPRRAAVFTHPAKPVGGIDRPGVSEFEQLTAFLSSLGLRADQETPAGGVPCMEGRVWLKPDDEAFADDLLREERMDPDRLVVLFAGAGTEYRQNPHIGTALCAVFAAGDVSVVSVGAAQDYELHERSLREFPGKHLNLCGRTSLRQTGAIIARARLAVGAETGAAHIACAVGTPHVIVVGGGHFGRFLPWPGARAGLTTMVSLPLACFGCDWRCHHARVHCVQDISAGTIALGIRAAWAENRSSHSRPARIITQDPLPESGVSPSPAESCTLPASLGTAEVVRAPAPSSPSVAQINIGRVQTRRCGDPRHVQRTFTVKELTGNAAQWNRSITGASDLYLGLGCIPELPILLERLNPREDWAVVIVDGDLPSGEIQRTAVRDVFAQDLVGLPALWKRSLHDRIGYFDQSFALAADYEFWLRAARQAPLLRLGVLPEQSPAPKRSAGGDVDDSRRSYELNAARERHWDPAWGPSPREQATTEAFCRLECAVRASLPRGSRVAIFGAGQHTRRRWRQYRRALEPHVRIAAILDDFPPSRAFIDEVLVLASNTWRTLGLEAIVVSSDTYEGKLWRRAGELVEYQIPVFSVYRKDLERGTAWREPGMCSSGIRQEITS